GLPGAAAAAARLGGDIAAWRAIERPAEDRRLGRADLRRARRVPLLRRRLGGHWRQGASPGQAADALEPDKTFDPERVVVTALVSASHHGPSGCRICDSRSVPSGRSERGRSPASGAVIPRRAAFRADDARRRLISRPSSLSHIGVTSGSVIWIGAGRRGQVPRGDLRYLPAYPQAVPQTG